MSIIPARGVFRNRMRRGGPNPIFWHSELRLPTFFWLSPIPNVKFGVLRGGAMAQCPPPLNTPLNQNMLNIEGVSILSHKFSKDGNFTT